MDADRSESWEGPEPDSLHEVEVLEVMDRIACAKLTAHWGVDYMHLAKVEGRWQILQVLWQSAPETGDS